eukprot:CFRG3772T1
MERSASHGAASSSPRANGYVHRTLNEDAMLVHPESPSLFNFGTQPHLHTKNSKLRRRQCSADSVELDMGNFVKGMTSEGNYVQQENSAKRKSASKIHFSLFHRRHKGQSFKNTIGKGSIDGVPSQGTARHSLFNRRLSRAATTNVSDGGSSNFRTNRQITVDSLEDRHQGILGKIVHRLSSWFVTEHYPYSEDPGKAWKIIEPLMEITTLKVPEVANIRSARPGFVRVVVISDTHSRPVCDLPAGDIIIHAGDFTMCGDTKEVTEFAEWFAGLNYKHKIVVAGNHEITFDIEGYEQLWREKHKMKRDQRKIKASLVNMEGITYLEDGAVMFYGYKFWGSPWQPKFAEWAFQRKRGKSLKTIWDSIPADVDILITHSPPVGLGDLTTRAERVGCVDLLYAVQMQIKPMYHLFGHVHEGYGMWSDGTTVFANASTCNSRYNIANSPIVFDLPVKETRTASIAEFPTSV